MKKLITLIFAFTTLYLNAQTVLINGATGGGFESGGGFAINGWTAVNDGNNQWYTGGFAVNSGVRAAYIDNNGGAGAANNYNAGSSRVSHFYRQITVTAAEPYLTLTFNWKGVGEGCCDYINVFIVPSATVPVAGSQVGTGQLGGDLNSSAAWSSFTGNTCVTAGTYNVIISWRNDGSFGTNPAGAIDNIHLVSNVAPTCLSQLGTGVTNVASLPYASGAGTTCGAVDDITSSNSITCGSSFYFDGEDRVWIFTPTATGQISINLTSGGSYNGLMLYNGCPLSTACTGGSATCIANSQSSAGNQSLNTCVTAGVTYYLVLDVFPSPTCNPYTNLTISAVVPPGSCASALGTGVTNVASLPYSSGASTTCGAGDDLTSTNTVACGSTSYLGGEDRVYIFTPSTSGSVNINLTSSGSYNGLMLYDGCPLTSVCSGSAGNCVASAYSSAGNQSLSACVNAGTTYYLVLDVFPSPSCNPITDLTISAVTAGGCNYTISTPSYSPDAAYTAGTLLTFPDDQFSANLAIGFSFCFYGTNYTNLVVSSNSFVSFNTALASTYSTWVTVPIPTATPASVVNSIMFPWHDVDPSVGSSSDIRYLTTGTSPNRKFIVNFSQVPMFSSSCNNLIYTGQLVLNETSNVIETYIQSKPICATWNSGNAVHGLNGPGGCDFSVVPGRNNTNWTATNDAKMFTPSGCCVTPLAADLLSFTGEQLNGKSNLLKWATASETDLDKFIIEKSENGNDFFEFHTVDAVGNSNNMIEYSATDNLPYDRTTYYRLKQVDVNGDLKYSQSIAINNSNWTGFSVLNLFPNPSSGLVNSEIYSSDEVNFTLEIRDVTGRFIQSTNHALIKGTNITNYDFTGLDGGIYFFTFIDQSNGKSSTLKFTKE
jgi:hypothetical protein